MFRIYSNHTVFIERYFDYPRQFLVLFPQASIFSTQPVKDISYCSYSFYYGYSMKSGEALVPVLQHYNTKLFGDPRVVLPEGV